MFLVDAAKGIAVLTKNKRGINLHTEIPGNIFAHRILKMIKKVFKSIVKIAAVLLSAVIVVTLYAHYTVENTAAGRLYENVDDIPHRKTALVLGTSKKLAGNRENLYYKYRMEAAAELFHAKKVDFLLLSGDNTTVYYDEPSTMKKDLLKMGIPENRIFLDYAGFRTLDSVVRSATIFGQDSITVVSQPFHNKRALYIADHNRIDAIGYNAQTVDIRYGFKTQLREKAARVKMLLDILINTKPKFGGEQIEIK